jgi:nucleotide-binding universal stress UspA family protein
MLRRILVPLDGSPHAKAAVSVAADIAIRTDAQLHLVHVVEVPEALAYPEYRAEDRAWAEQELAEIAAETAPGRVAVSTSVREGRILEEIQKEVAEWKADLMVMTTHGRGGVSRLWMGSVADRCVRSSSVPVLLVRPSEKGPAGAPSFTPSRVFVPLDGSALAETALPHATALAKAFGARLVLARGIAHFGTLDASHVSLNPKRLNRERTEAESYLGERAQAVQVGGVETEVVVLTEPGLAEAIAARAPDEVVVMTTNGRGGLDRAVFGSVADKVVRSATCPVLVIRPPRSAQGRDLVALSREIADASAALAVPASERR